MKQKNSFNIWMPISIVLFIALVASLMTNGFAASSYENAISTLNKLNANEYNPDSKALVNQAIDSLNQAWVAKSGNIGSNGSLVIDIYSDFECPFCSRAVPIVDQIKKEYPGIGIRFNNFPLSKIHPFAQKAAEAGECAREQGKFWEMHDTMFANQEALAVTDLKKYAAGLALDTGRFNQCLDSGAMAGKVTADLNAGVARGVKATPTFFVGTQKIEGALPYSQFKQAIDSQLKG
ncbi:MAG: thioredoxin domain-containing protein [Nanoarchaeota archaeon]|nr:thioredoxin domain-containing protein [Nanoarchaeota archaeon]